MSNHEILSDRIVSQYRDFTLTTFLDKNGEPIPRNDLYKCPMPTVRTTVLVPRERQMVIPYDIDSQDKMLFAPTYEIVNLFDPMPFEPTLANDLSSFTQVFIHTLLVERKLSRDLTPPELEMYDKMHETDPLALRDHRLSQELAAKAIVRYYDGWDTPRSERSKEAARSERYGDMVSIIKFFVHLLQLDQFQGYRNRFPTRWTLYEGDPKKTEEEYRKYLGHFAELAEDYEEVQARRKLESDAALERLLETCRREEAEKEKAQRSLAAESSSEIKQV